MKWRNISEEEIVLVLTQPDSKEAKIKDRCNAYKEINGRNIKVTYEESEEEIYVITAVVR